MLDTQAPHGQSRAEKGDAYERTGCRNHVGAQRVPDPEYSDDGEIGAGQRDDEHEELAKPPGIIDFHWILGREDAP